MHSHFLVTSKYVDVGRHCIVRQKGTVSTPSVWKQINEKSFFLTHHGDGLKRQFSHSALLSQPFASKSSLCKKALLSQCTVCRLKFKHVSNGWKANKSKQWFQLTLLSSLWFPYRGWYFLYFPWRYLLVMKRRLSSLQLEGVKASLGGMLAAQKLFTRSLPSNRNTCITGRV